MIIVLVGPPAGGKGTQAKILEKKYGFKKLTASKVLKDHAADDAKFHDYYETFQKERPGELLPDDVVCEIMAEYLKKSGYADDVIFDGFPRTLGQAEKFDALLKTQGQRLDAVIDIHFSDQDLEALVQRQLNRAQQALADGKTPRQTDLDPDIARKRVDIYMNQTVPVLKYFDQKNVLFSVDGARAIDDVAFEIDKIIRAFKGKKFDPPAPGV